MNAAAADVGIQRDPTLSEKVAAALINFIFDQGLQPGDRLPSEKDLGERFRVSRTVVREAVRSLVGKGLLRSQSGSRLTVTALGTAAVSEVLDLVVRGRTIRDPEKLHDALRQLHEVRSMIEVHIAGLAAQRATETELEELTGTAAMLARAETDEERSRADIEFHRLIAAATHNEFYLVMLDALQGPLLELRMATLRLAEGGPDAVRGHARILERLVAHDVEGARGAMAIHIAESGRALEQLKVEHLHGL